MIIKIMSALPVGRQACLPAGRFINIKKNKNKTDEN